MLADAERRRAAVVLPRSEAAASQTLFAGLQSHLTQALGAQAAGVLAAVGAVSIPNG
jgi:hypothetical protein